MKQIFFELFLLDLRHKEVHHCLLPCWKGVQDEQDKDVHHLVPRGSVDSLDGLNEGRKQEGEGRVEGEEGVRSGEGEGRRTGRQNTQ